MYIILLFLALLLTCFIGSIWGGKAILRCFSPKINNSNIRNIGQKCTELLDIDNNKEIEFQIVENIERSHVKVIEKYEKYKVLIKDDNMSKRISTIIHELIHIKRGHCDKVKDFDTSVSNLIINFYFDIIANFYEIKHFRWIKSQK